MDQWQNERLLLCRRLVQFSSAVLSVGNGPFTNLRFCLYDSLRFAFSVLFILDPGAFNLEVGTTMGRFSIIGSEYFFFLGFNFCCTLFCWV